MTALNGTHLDGREIYMDFSNDGPGGARAPMGGAGGNSGAPGESNTLFVGNVPFSADENMIR